MDTTESTSSRSKRQGGRHGARRTLVAIDRRGSRVQGVVLDAHDAGAPRIVETLDATDKTEMAPGDVFVIETPGGGGFGKA